MRKVRIIRILKVQRSSRTNVWRQQKSGQLRQSVSGRNPMETALSVEDVRERQMINEEMTDSFVNKFLTRDGETVEETKKRLAKE
jgi:hypothetical protein